MKAKQAVYLQCSIFLLLFFCLCTARAHVITPGSPWWETNTSTWSSKVSPETLSPVVGQLVPGTPSQEAPPPADIQFFSSELNLRNQTPRYIARQPWLMPRYPYKDWRDQLCSLQCPVPSLHNLRNRPMLA